MDDLWAVFQQLTRPEVDPAGIVVFNSRPVDGHDQWHIAKCAASLPVILVEVAGNPVHGRPAAIALENLRVEHSVRCSVRRPDGRSDVGRYTIIRCLSAEPEMHKCFLRTIGGALMGMEGPVAIGEVVNLIDRLSALFELVRRPRKKTFRGLWAELFVILAADNPSTMVDAWHGQPGEHFDFSWGVERLEVKSSASRARDHVFSLEQVYPPSGVFVLIASVQVEEQTNGRSLGELWDAVGGAVSNGDGRLKVERICTQALGEDLSAGRAFTGDWNLAVDSLAFYRVADIPRPPRYCPPGVSQMRFRSDVTRADPVGPGDLGSFHRCCIGTVGPGSGAAE